MISKNVQILANIRKQDPTRTLTLRNRFIADLKRRMTKVQRSIRTAIVDQDVFGLKEKPPGQLLFTNQLTPEQFKFETDKQKVILFMQWLRDMMNQEILEIFTGEQLGQAVNTAWTNVYIRSAYERGIQRSRQELEKAGYVVPKIDYLSGGLFAILDQPIHADRLGVLYTRTFTGLKGITDEMDKQISQILTQGLLQGDNPTKIAREINKRVDKIGKVRATILARTEIIRAHHVATIQEYENWGVVGISVMAEWRTAEDTRVCPICKKLETRDNGFGPGIYTLKMIRGMIPAHPQCRCIALPLDITDNAELQEKLKNAA